MPTIVYTNVLNVFRRQSSAYTSHKKNHLHHALSRIYCVYTSLFASYPHQDQLNDPHNIARDRKETIKKTQCQ